MLLVKEFGGSSAYPVGQMLKAKKTHEKLLLKRGIGGLKDGRGVDPIG